MKILACIDSGPASKTVLEMAVELGKLLGDDVEALHVREPDMLAPTELSDRAGVELRVVEGDPADEILAAIANSDVSIGVIGARRHRGGARPAGHIAIAIAENAGKPVAVVSPDSKRLSLRRVLVPCDGTSTTTSATDPFVSMLARAGLEIVAVHVFDATTAPPFWEGPGHHTDAWRQEFLARCCCHPGARLELRSGAPSAQLIDVTRDTEADLVVLAWSRDLSSGHARVVRAALAESDAPVILLPILEPAHRPETMVGL